MRRSSVSDEFCTVAQAAAIIGCTDGRVRQLIREKKIRVDKISERIQLIPKTEAVRLRDTHHNVGRPRISA